MQGSPCANFLLLIDYDNLAHRNVRPDRLLSGWLDTVKCKHPQLRRAIDFQVRAYGGWVQNGSVSDARIQAVIDSQRDWPSVFAHKNHYCRCRFEFADTLAETSWQIPLHRAVVIENTVVERASAPIVRKTKALAQCSQKGCKGQLMYEWLKRNRGCTHPKCPLTFAQCFQPREQKQVDVHLAVDLISFAITPGAIDQLAVFSDDLDLLPAFAHAAISKSTDLGLTLFRTRGIRSYMDAHLELHGMQIVNSI